MTTKTVDYKDVRAEATKPVAEREAIVKGRNGKMRFPRRYHMDPKRIVELRKDAGKSFPNPFRPTGVYHGFIQALIDLGIDKAHPFKDVKAEMKKIMSKIERGESNAWSVFADRLPKEDATNPKDLNGRIMQTATVLQRISGVHQYGLKLKQLKACVDVLSGKDKQPLYKLNTSFKRPEQVHPTNDLVGKRGRKSKS